MAEASIPMNPLNPGQVFACLGFLEAADVLLGGAEGGFDWSDEAHVRFILRANGCESAFAVVLQFLANAEIHQVAPTGYVDPNASPDAIDQKRPSERRGPELSESFPDRQGDRMALPIRLEHPDHGSVDIGHWADGSSRKSFKLYAGNRSAYSIAVAMLRGIQDKPAKKQDAGTIKTLGIDGLLHARPEQLLVDPFNVVTPAGGSFNFDPRSTWTAIDAGYSPNEHADHWTQGSPVVEFLAAWGLEHARPAEYQTRRVRYGLWGRLLPPILARPCLAGAGLAVPLRTYLFHLDMSGKNKVVTFARQETTV